ncbi:MAG: hypothetical protein AB7P20_06360 [Rhizobiaceae bacterium]
MANVNGKAPSVELTDALQAGFHAAMDRVKAANIDPCSTLVDQISSKDWSSCDASNEKALVVDNNGLYFDDEIELDQAA